MSYSPVFEEIVKKFKKICPSDVKVIPRQKHKNYFVPRQFFIHLPNATLSLICGEDRDFYMETALFDMKKKKVYFDENLGYENYRREMYDESDLLDEITRIKIAFNISKKY